jgi:hypothetical protein
MRKAARSITAPLYKSQPPATSSSPSTPKKRYYVYAIYVNGLIRYVGKGTNGRMHFHAIEARRINGRRALGANTDATTTTFYRNLAEAMREGAIIREEIIVGGLTDKQAYWIEKQKIEELFKQNKDQLWNTIDERLIGITLEEYRRKMQSAAGDRKVGPPPH